MRRATEIPEEWLMRPEERNGKPQTFTAAELMCKELPPVREVVPGVFPEGVSLLVGKPKMRKTFTALGLCISVATGGPST